MNSRSVISDGFGPNGEVHHSDGVRVGGEKYPGNGVSARGITLWDMDAADSLAFLVF